MRGKTRKFDTLTAHPSHESRCRNSTVLTRHTMWNVGSLFLQTSSVGLCKSRHILWQLKTCPRGGPGRRCAAVQLTSQKDAQAPTSTQTLYIFHAATSSAQAPSMQIHLPYGHVFSPSALALHFLIQDMWCPICRAGFATRMSISSVPLSIRHINAKKKSRSLTRQSTWKFQWRTSCKSLRKYTCRC